MSASDGSAARPKDDPALVRYFARELTAGSSPGVLIEELQRDYGYTATDGKRLIASARAALAGASLRGDEEIISNLEATSRGARTRVQGGLAILALVVVLAISSYVSSGRISLPGGLLIAGIVVGIGAAIRWWRTQRILKVHRSSHEDDNARRPPQGRA